MPTSARTADHWQTPEKAQALANARKHWIVGRSRAMAVRLRRKKSLFEFSRARFRSASKPPSRSWHETRQCAPPASFLRSDRTGDVDRRIRHVGC